MVSLEQGRRLHLVQQDEVGAGEVLTRAYR